jgi:hypothetical protein
MRVTKPSRSRSSSAVTTLCLQRGAGRNVYPTLRLVRATDSRQVGQGRHRVNITRTFGADLVRILLHLHALFCPILPRTDSRSARFIGAAGKD